MNRKSIVSAVCVAAFILTGFVGSATAADNKAAKGAVPASPLTDAGQKLEAQYAEQLKALRTEIEAALPKVSEGKIASLKEACAALKTAEEQAKAAGEAAGKSAQAKSAIGIWTKLSIPDAKRQIAEAQAQLKTATADDDRAALQKKLAAQENRLAKVNALLKAAEEEIAKSKDVQKELDQAKLAAQTALAQAKTNELNAAKAILAEIEPLLASDKKDAKLIKAAVLASATPRGLAEFAQHGKEQAALVEKLLADNALMKQMLIAGGAEAGKYGRAMEIYTAIQQASPKAKEGLFQGLALGVSLEHAVPVKQGNPQASTNAPAIVDPVKRYLHYEKACLNGELDPAFKDLTAWDYRNVVNGDEPDHILAWGREMLRNYRPDHILNSDYGWRYSGAVRTDVPYGSQNVKNDRPTLQNYQNIILNGGVCGRRAFFGRFILRCFGIPTVARPQTGHAALAHWTPEGWVINLGAGWGSGRVAGGSDTDFLLMTQARKVAAAYMEVLRAQWIARALGEQDTVSGKASSMGWWTTLALYKTKVIVAEAKPAQLAALGQELGEANESAETKARAVEKAAITEADKRVIIGDDGVITIPAAACVGVQPMKSFLGGLQAFCGGAFTCNLEVTRPGKYRVTARVVTVHDEGRLQLTANNAKDAVAMVIPYTCGQWEQTKPAEVMLVQGKNVLSFSKPEKGFTFKEFTLTPVK